MLTRMVLAVADPRLQKALEERISLTDIQVECINRSTEAWQLVLQSCADIVVISDQLIPAPIESGIATLKSLPEFPTSVILHDRDSTELQAQYIGAGADAALFSGISLKNLTNAIEATADSRRQAVQLERFDRRGTFRPKISDFATNSETMTIFMKEVEQVAPSDSLLLISGETGVGKEHLAKIIHSESPRANGPFVAVNTAALPEQLLESELFGHHQGAFTGATRSRRGAFEQAHGGTIFLDEIGEMPLHLQTKLLRVLQDYEVRPVGADKALWVDVRVIAATNRDLTQEVTAGNFRKDLFYRLSVITLVIPPLRQRREDIPTLARRFVLQFKHKIGRDIRQISEGAMNALCRYEWPGNVRELMNVVERSMLLCRGEEITISDLPGVFHSSATQAEVDGDHPVLPSNPWQGVPLSTVKQQALEKVEIQYLDMVLQQCQGHVGQAADLAGITARSLYTKMKQYSLDKQSYKKKPGGQNRQTRESESPDERASGYRHQGSQDG